MNNKTKITLSVFLFLGLIVFALLTYNTFMSTGSNNVVGMDGNDLKDAPDFTAKNADGNFTALSSLGNKPTIISFWATWCPGCVGSSPAFQRIHEQYGDEINVILVNVTDGNDETETQARNYISDNGYTFNVLYDVNLDASYAYGITALPTTFFITTDGKVAAKAMGQITDKGLKKGLEFIKN